MVKQLSQLIKLSKLRPMAVIAVAQAADKEVLEAVANAKKEGIADAVLVGDKNKISVMLTLMGEKPENYKIEHVPNEEDCPSCAVELIRKGKADILMKGLISTGSLMKAVINKDFGLRTGKTLSHTMFYEVPNYGKLICITDGGMNTFPNLEKKADILENALEVCKKLGNEKPSCACVCGAENVDEKIQSTVDARELSAMERFKKYNANVYGPVGLDLAISEEAVKHKKYVAEGAGRADILLVPTYEVGNGIGKAMTYFGKALSAGIIVGAKVPIVLVSRSGSAESKLYSIALATLM